MRVIAGTNRGMTLKAPRGIETRPTSDRLRGAVFSALGERVPGALVWDVCAGTGAIGIEALSRGARAAVFCENGPAALETLRANLLRARLEHQARVFALPWERMVPLLKRDQERFDLVYFDPPFERAQSGALTGLFLHAVQEVLGPTATVVVEHPSRLIPPACEGLDPVKTLRSGSVSATLFRRQADGVAGAAAAPGREPRLEEEA